MSHQSNNTPAYINLLRGGRMAKFKGVAASIAPMLRGGTGIIMANIGKLSMAFLSNLKATAYDLPLRTLSSTSVSTLCMAIIGAPIAITLSSIAAQAQDVCSPTAADPTVINCAASSTDPQGISGGGTVTIGPNVDISSGPSALFLQDANSFRVVVDDTSSLAGGQAIQIRNVQNFTLENNGELSGSLRRAVGNASPPNRDSTYRVINSGRIIGPSLGDPRFGREAVRIFGNALASNVQASRGTDVYVENTLSGVVNAPVGRGLNLQGATGTIINNGTITAGTDGMELSFRQDLSVNVGASGTIDAGRFGISLTSSDGLRFPRYTGQQDINIEGDVYGEIYGLAVASGIQTVGTSVRIGGTVRGGLGGGTSIGNLNGAAIAVGRHQFGASTANRGVDILIDTDGEISAETGLAIHDFANPTPPSFATVLLPGTGASNITVRGSLLGDVVLTAGGDTVTIESGAILGDQGRRLGANGITLDGDNFSGITNPQISETFGSFVAGDIDEFSFDGWTGNRNSLGETDVTETDIDVGQIVSFERVLVTGGADVTFGNSLRPSIGFGSNNAIDGFRFEVAQGASARLADSLSILGDVTSNGLIDLSGANGLASTVLRVENNGVANFTGNGGLLRLDTALGDDGSATDQLVVDNSRLGSGATGVLIMNAGGTGAQTLADGIKVVDVTGGTSDMDAFVLAERAFAGAYEYNLFQNGVTDSSDGDWYLRSIGINSTGATYEAAPSILGGFNRMSTLAQRAGQRQWADSDAAGGDMQPSGAWLRFTGDRTDLAADTGTNTSTDSWGLQAGIDFDVDGGEAGNWVLGVTTQYGTSNASVTNALGFGDIDSEGYGLGLTATWYGNSGTYFDAQAQANWISSDFSSSTGGVLATGQDSTAYALSAEVGHRFELSETSALIPQAQLILGQVDGASFTDTAGNAVDLGSNSSTVGRLGLAYEYESGDNTFYAIANILHDFSGANTVDVAGASLSSNTSETWGEFGVGGSIAMNETTNFYGEVSYRQAFDNSDSSALAATAGISIKW